MNHLIRVYHDWRASPLRTKTPEPTDVFWAKCQCGWRMDLTYDQYQAEYVWALTAHQHNHDTGAKPGTRENKTEAR